MVAKSETSSERAPVFPEDISRFSEWATKMKLYLHARELLSVVLIAPTHIPYTKKLSDEEYIEWIKQCNGRSENAELALATLKGSNLVNDEDIQFKNEITKCAI